MPIHIEPTRFLCLRDIKRLCGYSNSHLKRLEAAGKFPRRVRLGDGRAAWVELEYQAWAVARVADRDGRAA